MNKTETTPIMNYKYNNSLTGILAILIMAIALQAFSAPEVRVISSTEIDYGTYPVKDPKKAVVRVRNIGDALLEIKRVRQSCNCTTIKIKKKMLRPGETGSIDVRFKPYSIFEKFKKRLFIETNDPQKRFITIIIKGNPIPIAHVRPSRKFYPRYMPINKTYEQIFTLLTTQKGVKLGKPEVKSNYKTTLTQLAEKGIKTGRMLHYSLKVTPDQCGPDLDCKVNIPILSPKGWKPIEITIKCRVGLRLYPLPQTFTFSPEEKGPVTKRFQLRLLGDPSMKLDSTLLNKPKEPGINYEFGEYEKISLPITVTFDSIFLEKLKEKQEILLNYSYPGTNEITIKCKLELPQK